MATATARVTITKEGFSLHVAAMCSAFGGATPCLYLHGHKGKCIHHRWVTGVTLQRVFAPLQGGGFLTAHHGLFFVNFLQLLFSLQNNPLFAPCNIQALKNPVSPLMLYLLHSSKNPISLLTIYPGSYCTFCQGKPCQRGGNLRAKRAVISAHFRCHKMVHHGMLHPTKQSNNINARQTSMAGMPKGMPTHLAWQSER